MLTLARWWTLLSTLKLTLWLTLSLRRLALPTNRLLSWKTKTRGPHTKAVYGKTYLSRLTKVKSKWRASLLTSAKVCAKRSCT